MPNNDLKNNGARVMATTLQILGGSTQAPRVDPKWKFHHDLLLGLRTQLGDRKGSFTEIAKEQQPAFSLHIGDAGTDEFDRDFALSMMSSDQNALYEIDEAIQRIRQGSYGVCEISGQPIEAERLAAIPWTRYSAEAQRELELNGSAARTRLGERGSLTDSAKSDDAGDESEAA